MNELKGLERISVRLSTLLQKELAIAMKEITSVKKISPVAIIIRDDLRYVVPIKWDRSVADGKQWFSHHFFETANELRYEALIIVSESSVDVTSKEDGKTIEHTDGFVILAKTHFEAIKIFVPVSKTNEKIGNVQVSFSNFDDIFGGDFK